MGLDFSLLIYKPNFDQWARQIVFDPVVSQPALGSVSARAIWHCDQLEDILEDGSIFVGQRVSVDILESEFPVLPQQGDQITVLADGTLRAEGPFEVVSRTRNGGGETNLVLRELVTAVP